MKLLQWAVAFKLVPRYRHCIIWSRVFVITYPLPVYHARDQHFVIMAFIILFYVATSTSK